MNSSTLRFLGFIVAFLIAAWLLVESGDESDLPDSGMLLFPDMESALNDVQSISISRAGTDTLVINRVEGAWGLADRGNYPALVDSIRDVLMAMAQATVVEPKTADPARHSRLGVDDPVSDLSKAVLVKAVTGDREFSLIFGNVAQGTYRYARIAGDDQSWLIDQNPEIPASVGDWLEADIVDIPSTRIRSVTITHPDGESITASKESESDTDFVVADIPDERELSYSTVANGFAGALNDLDLDDVRAAVAAEPEGVVAEFVTFDGLKVTATTVTEDGENWLSLTAESLTDDAGDAEEINARIAGWQFRIADYKANLLNRRWEDILKPVETEEE